MVVEQKYPAYEIPSGSLLFHNSRSLARLLESQKFAEDRCMYGLVAFFTLEPVRATNCTFTVNETLKLNDVSSVPEAYLRDTFHVAESAPDTTDGIYEYPAIDEYTQRTDMSYAAHLEIFKRSLGKLGTINEFANQWLWYPRPPLE